MVSLLVRNNIVSTCPLVAGPQNACPFTPYGRARPLRKKRVFNSEHTRAQVCDMVHARLVGAFFRKIKHEVTG